MKENRMGKETDEPRNRETDEQMK